MNKNPIAHDSKHTVWFRLWWGRLEAVHLALKVNPMDGNTPRVLVANFLLRISLGIPGVRDRCPITKRRRRCWNEWVMYTIPDYKWRWSVHQINLLSCSYGESRSKACFRDKSWTMGLVCVEDCQGLSLPPGVWIHALASLKRRCIHIDIGAQVRAYLKPDRSCSKPVDRSVCAL